MRSGLSAWAGAILCCAGTAFGLAEARVGPDSPKTGRTFAQPHWPVGLVEIPRHPCRVFSFSEGAGKTFYFDANASQIQELLLLFSKTRMRDHEVWLKERNGQELKLGKKPVEYNVTLTLPADMFWGSVRAADSRGTGEPTLTIFIALNDDSALADTLEIPDNLIVHNEVEGFPVKGKATKPKREALHCLVRFTDSTPVTYPLMVQATLWERNVKEGIKLGKVEQGSFEGVFSEQELTDLKSGKSWIALTAGNWMSEPKSNDPKLPPDKLTREIGNNEVVTISTPPLYYGRLLFEDGSPVTKRSYMLRNVLVEFPYCGSAEVDSEGYFKVCFTGDQLEKAKARDDKNIYIPDDAQWNRSTALYIFPASKLSRDKATAGVVRIPRPPASVPAE